MSQMGMVVCTADPPPCYADSMALLAPPGKEPVFTGARRPHLALAHPTSVPSSRRSFSVALSAHRAFVNQTLSNPGVRWVRAEKDITSLQPNKLGVLFGMQHAPGGMTKTNVGELRAARLQVMALAYDGPTEYGDDFNGNGGLTDRGRELLGWMSEHNLILDLSRASHRTAREALECIQQERLPIHLMVSHTGCHKIFQHPRNLPDDILKEVRNRGGYVGVSIIPSLLAQNSDPYSVFVRHIAHASRVCGPDNVGIGSGTTHVDFKNLEKSLAEKFSASARVGFLGLNFECFLFRSLPS